MSSDDNGIRHNDRVLIMGDTGSGKSEAINFFWEQFQTQRLLLDSKDEFSVPDPTAEVRKGQERPMLKAVHDVDKIDWRQPIIHYVPRTEKADEMDDLFTAAYNSPHPLLVAAHEISDVCEYQPSKTPGGFNSYVSKGRVREKGLLAGSQLPFHMPTRAKTLNQHVIVLVPRFVREADLKAIAEMVGADWREFSERMDALHEQLGDYAFAWFDRRTRAITACMPLDEQARSRITIVRRVDG